ncbi:hypothetical protein JCM10450v2_004117 [Rhodotorula kratochvilovae]
MRDRYDDDPGDDSAGYDDEKGGGGGASYADDQQPPFDPSKNYRFRHEAVFLCTTVTVCALDLLVAGFISYEHFGVEAYVWGIAVAVSVIEGLFIGGSVALIEFHVGTHKHWDMVIPQAFIWAGSLTINIVFLLGAMGNKADSPKMFIFIAFLVAASQLSGLALAIVGSRTHILLLEDPNPEKHGFHPKGEKKRHRWGRRHKHGRKGRDDDDDA